jgi:hypothetical protein
MKELQKKIVAYLTDIGMPLDGVDIDMYLTRPEDDTLIVTWKSDRSDNFKYRPYERYESSRFYFDSNFNDEHKNAIKKIVEDYNREVKELHDLVNNRNNILKYGKDKGVDLSDHINNIFELKVEMCYSDSKIKEHIDSLICSIKKKSDDEKKLFEYKVNHYDDLRKLSIEIREYSMYLKGEFIGYIDFDKSPQNHIDDYHQYAE